MEKETDTNKNNNTKVAIVIVVLIVIISLASLATRNLKDDKEQVFSSNTETVEIDDNNIVEDKNEANENDTTKTYTAVGDYTSPGGPRHINVEITLVDSTITAANVEPTATDPVSKEKQEDFAANYKDLVIGKRIDDLTLDKVSGSSLTPKGFNDALEKIRSQIEV
jgi:hypothetical protein